MVKPCHGGQNFKRNRLPDTGCKNNQEVLRRVPGFIVLFHTKHTMDTKKLTPIIYIGCIGNNRVNTHLFKIHFTYIFNNKLLCQ